MTAHTPPAPWHPRTPFSFPRKANDRPLLWAALLAAGLLHLAALCLPLPRVPPVEVPAEPDGPVIDLTEWHIQPPSTPRPEPPPPSGIVRRIPLPSPDARFVEPVEEPESLPPQPVEPAALSAWVGIEPLPPAPPDSVLDERTPGVERPVALPGRVQPVYPEAARRAGVEGTVVLSALITARGDVESIEVVRESRPGLGFGEAAVQAVRTWKYRPGSFDGRPVAVMLTVVVEFRLR